MVCYKAVQANFDSYFGMEMRIFKKFETSDAKLETFGFLNENGFKNSIYLYVGGQRNSS